LIDTFIDAVKEHVSDEKTRERIRKSILEAILRRRAQELATAATRALSDPLAAWALRRIQLEGHPFRFEATSICGPSTTTPRRM